MDYSPTESDSHEDKDLAHVGHTEEDNGGSKHLRKPVPSKVPVDRYPKQAYLYLLTNDNYMTHLFVMEASFRDVETTRRRIALVTPKVTEGARATLRRLGIEVRNISQPTHPNFKVDFPRWADMLAKFAIFEQTDLDKFVYFDTDYIVNANLDYLFELPTDNMVYSMLDGIECKQVANKVNAGLLVAKPDPDTRANLFRLLENPTRRYGNGEQDMLQDYLTSKNMITTLPEQDFTFIWRCICVQKKEIPEFDPKKVKAVHFTGFWLNSRDLVHGARGWKEECGKPYYERWLRMLVAGLDWWDAKYPGIKATLSPESQDSIEKMDRKSVKIVR